MYIIDHRMKSITVASGDDTLEVKGVTANINGAEVGLAIGAFDEGTGCKVFDLQTGFGMGFIHIAEVEMFLVFMKDGGNTLFEEVVKELEDVFSTEYLEWVRKEEGKELPTMPEPVVIYKEEG